MADAMSAFREALAAYRKSMGDFILYSVIMNVVSFVLAAILALVLVVAGALTLGSALTGPTLSFGLLGLGATVIILLIALLIFAWVASGLNGSYLESVSMFMAGRKQTLGGFFKSVPRLATPVLAVAIITGLAVGIPAAIAIGLLSLAGSIGAILGILVAVAYACIMALLLVFSMPAVVLDGKPALAAVKLSLSAGSRHFMGLIIYVIICAIAAIPMLIPGVNLLYGAIFYMPLTSAALISLYRKAK